LDYLPRYETSTDEEKNIITRIEADYKKKYEGKDTSVSYKKEFKFED